MASAKPLTLRRQKGKAGSSRREDHDEVTLQAEVFVETGVFHLDQTFSYLVPTELSSEVTLGSVVKVPFKDKEVLGIVAAVKPIENAGLRRISSLLLSAALAPEDLLLAEAITERYVAQRFDVFKLLLPPLSAKSMPVGVSHRLERASAHRYSRRFLLSKVSESPIELAVDFVADQARSSFLVILPTQRDIEEFKRGLLRRGIEDFVEYDGGMKPAERRRVFLEARDGHNRVVIGSRSAVLLPMSRLDHLVVVNEASEHYFEKRAPYWNARDVALLRADLSRINITFVGSVPSLELWRLIEMGWIDFQKGKPRVLAKNAKIRHAPDTYHSTIREGLKKGVVLVSVSTKNYSNTFICRKCRTASRCHCGGKIIIAKKGLYACNICEESSNDWRCKECGSLEILAFRGGAEKVYEEIGKAFPRVPIKVNTADKPIEVLSHEPSIVVSTYGVEPIMPGGYSALVLLDGEELLSRPFIRAEEELRQRWFNLAGLMGPGGSIFLSISAHHPIAQSFISNRIERSLNLELLDRTEVKLPPSVRVLRISGETRALMSLRQKLVIEHEERVSVLYSQEGNILTVKCEHEIAPSLLKGLRALQKVRSLSKKELFKIEVDPYLI